MNKDSQSGIAQEAAEWFMEMSDAGSRRRADFLEWLRSPAHTSDACSANASAMSVSKVTGSWRWRRLKSWTTFEAIR
jgi:hypothetical protein